MLSLHPVRPRLGLDVYFSCCPLVHMVHLVHVDWDSLERLNSGLDTLEVSRSALIGWHDVMGVSRYLSYMSATANLDEQPDKFHAEQGAKWQQ
jgi:hypothetical protein